MEKKEILIDLSSFALLDNQFVRLCKRGTVSTVIAHITIIPFNIVSGTVIHTEHCCGNGREFCCNRRRIATSSEDHLMPSSSNVAFVAWDKPKVIVTGVVDGSTFSVWQETDVSAPSATNRIVALIFFIAIKTVY